MKLFDGKTLRLCVDQYGQREYAATAKELAAKCDRKRADRMFVDRMIDGAARTVHVGYVIAGRWFTVYAHCESVQ